MTTTTLSPRLDPRRNQRAFTLVEVLIGATLSVVILAAVLSSFLFLVRSGANIRNYNDMEAQARKSLELFAEDTRQASSVKWTSSTSLTLTVNMVDVVYQFGSATFTRTVGAGSATTLLTGITAFSFLAYDINGAAVTDFSTATARTTANNATKQIQISLSAARSNTTVVAATNIVLSARYVLRNKRVTA